MFWPISHRSTTRSQSFDSPNTRYNQNPQSKGTVQQLSQFNRIIREDNKFKQKVNTFLAVNKKHQSDEVCVCQDCIYAKQLNKYQILKMDLTKNSSYRAQYNKQLLKRNLSNTVDLTDSKTTNKPDEGNISLSNPYVHIDSNYNNEFISRSLQKIEKPKPKDELKFTGPLANSSFYKKQYYSGIAPPSQFLQPVKEELLPSRKFTSGSLYSQSYKGNKLVQTESGKTNDQLRLGKPLVVKQSTNKCLFQSPNPQIYTKKVMKNDSYSQKRMQTPNLSFQYKTINRDEFDKPSSKKNCRSKRMQVLHGYLLTQSDLSTIS